MIELLIAWLLTYWIHSAIVLGGMWVASQWLRERNLAMEEAVWRTALFVTLLTATIQLGLTRQADWRPLAGSVEVHSVTAASPTDAKIAEGGPKAAHSSSTEPKALLPGPAQIVAPFDNTAASYPDGERAGAPGNGTDRSRLMELGLIAWLAVMAALMLRLAASYVWLLKTLRGRSRVSGGRQFELLARLCDQAGVSRSVALSVCRVLSVPLALGLRRWEVCVPSRVANRFEPEEQETVLAHELAHLVRRDTLWQFASRAVAYALFMQPLNFVALARLSSLAELRCDDWAVARTGRPVTLARCLTRVASWRSNEWERLPVPAMAGARRSDFGRRVRRLLNRSYPQPQAGVPRWLGLATVPLILVFVLAAPGVVESAREAPLAPHAPRAPQAPRPATPASTPTGAVPEVAPVPPASPAEPEETAGPAAPAAPAAPHAPAVRSRLQAPTPPIVPHVPGPLAAPHTAPPVAPAPEVDPALAPVPAPASGVHARLAADPAPVPTVATRPASRPSPAPVASSARPVLSTAGGSSRVRPVVAGAPEALRDHEAPEGYSDSDSDSDSDFDSDSDSGDSDRSDDEMDDFEEALDDEFDALEDDIESELEALEDELDEQMDRAEDLVDRELETGYAEFEDRFEDDIERLEDELEDLEQRSEEESSRDRRRAMEWAMEAMERSLEQFEGRHELALERIMEQFEREIEQRWDGGFERQIERALEERERLIERRLEAAERQMEAALRQLESSRDPEDRRRVLAEAREQLLLARPSEAELAEIRASVERIRLEMAPRIEEVGGARAELRAALEEWRARYAAELESLRRDQRQTLSECE